MKLLIAGPLQSGKTSIANFLSNSSQNGVQATTGLYGGQISDKTKAYSPTVGVRILEFNSNSNSNGGGNNNNNGGESIELWDLSGSQDYEGCWPAALADTSGQVIHNPNSSSGQGGLEDEVLASGKNASQTVSAAGGLQGVILVYNPSNPQGGQEVGLWYDQFVKASDLPSSSCLVLVHDSQGTGGGGNGGGAAMKRIPPKLEQCQILHCDFDSGVAIKREFEDFVQSLKGKGNSKDKRGDFGRK
jgi:hypothetical protein